MKRKMKRLVSAALVLACLSALPCTAMAEETEGQADTAGETYTLIVNGKTLDMDGLPCAPYYENGVLMVPLRLISEALGYRVGWDEATGEITVDDDYIQAAALYEGTAEVSFTGHLKVINMTYDWTNDAPTVIHDGYTYVPLSFFERFFNDATVDGMLISVAPSMAELCSVQ